MEGIWKKLGFKTPPEVLILQAPESFLPAMEEIRTLTNIRTQPDEVESIDFCLVFTTRQEEVNFFAEALAPFWKEDAVVWFCYPKGSSKKYQCDFNRDTGWAILGKLGLEPVRQVAIDEDWSALRFRKVEFIKTMTRGFAMTDDGKKRTQKKNA